ncbi:MAG TPA: nucleotidyltransferase family protein [Gammaproteobacteria bacterium]|jgi:MurNAc alpha-1-phosphate uridylyltransferase|nr:nucleotidyltransferase family protein [Gammaproteobacteria bacterium]
MRAMILAAGRGERMGPLTAERPKPLLTIGGMALIERHVARLAACGIDEIVINLSYRGEQIRRQLGDGDRFGAALRYSDEGEPPLETAGGIVQALPLLGQEPFLLVNSDVFTDFDFGTLVSRAVPTLVLVPNPAHNARGDFGLDPAGRVQAQPRRYTYAGIAVLDPAPFAALEPGRRPLKPVLDAAIARGELQGAVFEGLWIDVGTPERLEAARAVAAGR